MSEQQREMLEYTVQELASYLIEDCGMTIGEALDRVYSSQTFEKLSRPETGLYLEGAAYVYELLKKEIGAV